MPLLLWCLSPVLNAEVAAESSGPRLALHQDSDVSCGEHCLWVKLAGESPERVAPVAEYLLGTIVDELDQRHRGVPGEHDLAAVKRAVSKLVRHGSWHDEWGRRLAVRPGTYEGPQGGVRSVELLSLGADGRRDTSDDVRLAAFTAGLSVVLLPDAVGVPPLGGTLVAMVVDDQGEPLPAVTVAVENSEVSRVLATDEKGRAVFEGLVVGRYTVNVELDGFSPVIYPDVTIDERSARGLSIELFPAIECWIEISASGDGN